MAKQNKAKNIKALNKEAMKRRLDKMINIKHKYLTMIREKGYEEVLKLMHLMPGNDKTGKACWTISLIPVHDCVNCSGCAGFCYDLRNDCIYPSVLESRALNSALKEVNVERFWERVGELVAEGYVTELRINIGGDLKYEDFSLIDHYVAVPNPRTDILFFTKNYNGIDTWLDNNEFSSNVHPMRSLWCGMDDNGNRHNMPCSHVLWADGTTTAPEFGAYYCRGCCTACHFKGEGCWTLKNNEHVIFMAH